MEVSIKSLKEGVSLLEKEAKEGIKQCKELWDKEGAPKDRSLKVISTWIIDNIPLECSVKDEKVREF